MRAHRIRVLALASLCLILTFLLLARSFVPGASAGRSSRDLSLVESIIRLIKDDYIDRVDAGPTMEGAYRGLVQSLDPLSSYLSAEELAEYKKTDGFFDPGIILIKDNGGLPRVIGLEEGRPAASSALKLGDFISSVDDRATFGLSRLEVQLLLRSRQSRPAKLRVVRQAATEEIFVDRSAPRPEACSYLPERGTAGILSVRRLSPSLAPEAKAAIPKSTYPSTAPLVLDLRKCAEGDPESARRFVNLFMKTSPAGSFLSQNGTRDEWSCPEEAFLPKTPLVIWVDHPTIGAAEIVAASLQAAKRARIIGRRTMGLAGRQTLHSLGDGSALLLTSAVFILPSGEKLWEKGVVPDVVLDRPTADAAAERAAFLQKTLQTAGGR